MLKDTDKQRKEAATKDWPVRYATEQATKSETYRELLQRDKDQHPVTN